MRIKALSLFMTLVIFIIFTASLAVYYNFKINVIDDIELRISNTADEIILSIADSPENFRSHPAKFLSPRSEEDISTSDLLVQFMDNNGNVIAKSPNLKKKTLYFVKGDNDLLRDIEIENGLKLKVYQKNIEVNGVSIGYLVLGVKTSHLFSSLNYLRNSLIIIMLCVLIVTAFGWNIVTKIEMINAKKQFLSFASHELRTPLSVISGNAELALNNKFTNDQYKEALLEIKNETIWMSRLVTNLLALFRNESGAERVNKQEMNISELIVTESSALKKRYPKKKITVNLSEVSTIKADPHHIKKVIANLLENAAKYSSEDGKVNIALYDLGKKIKLVVTDDGVGIKKELIKNIFDPYYRINEGRTEGMGLGLAISKWYITAHGGNIFVESTPNKGSIFTIILPRS